MFPKNRKGVIIIACLWGTALVLWLAMNAALLFRYRFSDSTSSSLRTIGFYAALGGIYETIARIPPAGLETNYEDRNKISWKPDQAVHTLNYGRCTVYVRAEDELEKININLTSSEELAKVLREILQVEELYSISASRLADRILDFIDPDDYVRDQGAEKEFYEKAGIGYLPYNGPLPSIELLLLVPGVSWNMFWGKAERDSAFLPGKSSFFSLFTVYGSKKSLEAKMESDQTENTGNVIWKPGGLYRVVSGADCGGNRKVVLYSVVKYNPGQSPYFAIQYVKELL